MNSNKDPRKLTDQEIEKLANNTTRFAGHELGSPPEREARFLAVLDALESQVPVDRSSPIIVVAPRAMHNLWRFTVNSLKEQRLTARKVLFMNVLDLKHHIPNMHISHILFIDEMYPDQRPVLKVTLSLMNPNLNHRVFATRPPLMDAGVI